MQNASANALVPRETARPAPMADIQKIAQHMARLNVAALPRNYELFHEAIVGLNAGLAQDIAALGPQPQQPMLDELGLKYRLVGHCGLAGETSRNEASRMLREVAERLAEGLKHKNAFARACGTILKSVSGNDDQSLAAFLGEIDYLTASLTTVLSAEMEIGVRLQDDIRVLETLERGISAMQSATVADRITGLPNRIALNRTISDLYAREEGAAGSALIMVDIDNFSDLNDRYGTQAGNKLLKKLAGLFRKCVKKNDFIARTEADEFALLFSHVGMQDAIFATSDKADPGRLTISIGVALSTDAATPGQLQANARVALLAAQSNPRQPVQAFGR
jgi:diguanylate cyclase (GGDEF)-like protein